MEELSLKRLTPIVAVLLVLGLARCAEPGAVPGGDRADGVDAGVGFGGESDEPPIRSGAGALADADAVGVSGVTHRVAVERTVLMLANARGDDPGAGGRPVLLDRGAEVEVRGGSERRARVMLPDGRTGYVFAEDLEEIPAPVEAVSVPVLDERDAAPAFPVERDTRPVIPVDPSLLEEVNQLDMPDM